MFEALKVPDLYKELLISTVNSNWLVKIYSGKSVMQQFIKKAFLLF